MAIDSMLKRIEPILVQIQAMREEIDRLEEEDPRSEPFPPTPPKDIDAAEKRLGFEFPPSYRAFLHLHNGWKQIQGDTWIAGVSGPAYSKIHKQREHDTAMFAKILRRQNKNWADKLKQEETSNPEVIYLPGHPVVGTNFNGDYLVFDRNRPGKQGEYPVARVIYGDTVERRFPDFFALIDYSLKDAREELDLLGGDPDKVAAASKAGEQSRQSTTKQPASHKKEPKSSVKKTEKMTRSPGTA